MWNHAVFSKNRDRLLNAELAQLFFAAVSLQARQFMSDEHFTVDGTLIQAWASQKSFRPKDGSDKDGDGTNFHGGKRSNETHESTTDPDARLYKKSYGKESILAYLGHALVENRNGLIAQAMVTTADGFAEREAALLLLAAQQQGSSRRITVGADKAYDSKDFVAAARALKVTPHITKNDNGRRTWDWDKADVIDTDKAPTYGIAISELKAEGRCPENTLHRQIKYLHNVVEASYGKLQQLVRPVRGFKTLKTAYPTIRGIRGDFCTG